MIFFNSVTLALTATFLSGKNGTLNNLTPSCQNLFEDIRGIHKQSENDIALSDIGNVLDVTPTFKSIGPLCQNSAAPVLLTNSTNTPPIKGTWNPATINTAKTGTTTYTFTPDAGQNATNATMDIVVLPSIIPTFNKIGPLCLNSPPPTLPTNSTNIPSIRGTWNPATITTSPAGTRTYVFTPQPQPGQCIATASMTITINSPITPSFPTSGQLCLNSTPPALPTNSLNNPPITGTWIPPTINTGSVGTRTYIFTPTAGQCASTASLIVQVATQITPTFNPIGQLCLNSTPPALPASSTNMPPITGTWSPAAINTTKTGTTTYTFTPTPGGCGTTTTLNVEIVTQIIPVFNQIGPLCQNAAAPSLPTSSRNTPAIRGTWSPATISTSTVGTKSYTFTPNPGQCGGPTTMNITVREQVTPTFTQIGPLCQGTTPPPLPTNSNNVPPISGSWSPATINTASTGTRTYTFTPKSGQCAPTVRMNIYVRPQTVPTFSQIGPLCLNSTPPPLPTSSTNKPPITGFWTPATVSTTRTGTTTYTFTPIPVQGQCFGQAKMNISVVTQISPTFTLIGPLCMNSTPPALPTSSRNNPPIKGTWSPATINTTKTGTTTYTFTPNAGQCGGTVRMNITILWQVVPKFNKIGPLCLNSKAPALPTSSTNSPPISGTWSPATISTTRTGTTTYTFTPKSGQCAVSTTMSISVVTQITPTFNQIGQVCMNSTPPPLPTSSTNNPPITGTWNPATINTGSLGTRTFIFTPAAGQCALTTFITVNIVSQITPTFIPIGPLCLNAPPPALPTSSRNTPPITGTWSPPTINTTRTGTTTYSFNPAPGQCAAPTTMKVEVTTQIVPIFSQIGPLCLNSSPPLLPASSTNSPTISGTWNPTTINTTRTGTTTYTFTPAPGQCAASTTMRIDVNSQVTPTFTQIGPLCLNSTPPSLPPSSGNKPAISGTWNPATINTSSTGSRTYTFTPRAGQCATTATMTIAVVTDIVPSFNQIGTVCLNSVPPLLPTSSNNNPPIRGSWYPSIINTGSTGSRTYIFVPDAGQCAASFSMTIRIIPLVLPTFPIIGPFCQNSSPPMLPAGSTNSPTITGTWNPATINTTRTGITTYTFTPAAGQCATSTTINIEIGQAVSPTFAQIGPLCLNSAPPALPSGSTNSPAITGTWNPSTINTTRTGTTTYVFTPANGQCAATATMNIEIATQIIPTFIRMGQLCLNSSPPALPAVSTNNPPITGTWNPATISTTRTGTTTYTFTPAPGQCATITTMEIEIVTHIVPTFSQINPLCLNSTPPSLPVSSTNNPSITGTWNPATISTADIGTRTYFFTPNSGQCATSTTMNIRIVSQITPALNPIGPLCLNSTPPSLPFGSTNSPTITGTWTPATISTTRTGTTTYTFTPAAGQCAAPATMNISVIQQFTPVFNPIGPFCQNSVPPSLPTVTPGGITGTWNPATINTGAVGTSTYTFTPDAGQCATKTTVDIIINRIVKPTFSAIGPLPQNSAPPALPARSNNNITGTWNPAVINTARVGRSFYFFTPGSGFCADTASIAITVEFVDYKPVANNDKYTAFTFSELIRNVASNDVPSADGGNVWTRITNATKGTLAFRNDGSFTYTPFPTSSGADNFRYRLCDADGDCVEATVIIEIIRANDQPQASDVVLNTVEDTPLLNVKVTDYRTRLSLDLPNSFTVLTGPKHGEITYWKPTDGSFSYKPASGYTGEDQFTYNLCDGNGDCSVGIVKIVIIPVNHIPVVADDYFKIFMNSTLSGTVTVNDLPSRDGGNKWLHVSGPFVTSKLDLKTDGSFVFTPTNGYTGDDGFLYKLCDVDNDCANAKVIITIVTPPVAVNDTFNVEMNLSFSGNVSLNDKTGGMGNNRWSINSGTPNGTVSLTALGLLAYNPKTGFTGLDYFSYRLCDSLGASKVCSQAMVYFNVRPPLPVPTLSVSHPSCSVTTGFITVTAPLGTDYKYSKDGISFQDSPIFTGLAGSATYTITARNQDGRSVTARAYLSSVPPVPDPPKAVIIDPTCTIPGTLTIQSPLGAVYDYSINNLTFQSSPVFTGLSAGTYSLTVRNKEGCTVSGEYRLNQPDSPKTPTIDIIHPTCLVPTGTILIKSVETNYTYNLDGSEFKPYPASGYTNVFSGQHTTGIKSATGCTTIVNVTVKPAPGKPVRPDLIVTQPTCKIPTGLIQIKSDTAQLRFSFDKGPFMPWPKGDFRVTTSKDYTIVVKNSDGCTDSVTVKINPVTAAPALPDIKLINTTCKDTLANIGITSPTDYLMFSLDGKPYAPYQPEGYPGLKIETHKISVINSESCTVTLTVNLKLLVDPTPPVAKCKNLNLQLDANNRLTLNPAMVDNGSYDNCEIKKTVLSKTLFTCDDTGKNTITLKVYDPVGNQDSCKAVITIRGNQPPIALADYAKIYFGQAANIPVFANDSDPNSKIDSTSLQIISDPNSGKVTKNNSSGILTYLPDQGFSGTDRFIYRICDDGRPCVTLCDTAVVTIVVLPENHKPVAVNDTYEAGCLPVMGNILENDYDPDNNKIILNTQPLKTPKYGDFSVLPDGEFTYTAKTKYSWKDSIIYKICDDGFPPKCDTATVYINTFLDADCDGIPDITHYDLFVPESFSPNGDDLHDYFEVYGIENYPDAEMVIFNRWGNLVFKKEHYGNLKVWGSAQQAFWDGRSNGNNTVGTGYVPIGNYVYILDLKNGTTHKGLVMVAY